MNVERRVNARLRPMRMTYVALRPDFIKLGRLLDISLDGLSFQYIAYDDQSEDTTFFNIDLFMNKYSYHLKTVPCKRIYDTANNDGMVFAKRLELRRCGLQFKKLTETQVLLLKYYLTNYTDASLREIFIN